VLGIQRRVAVRGVHSTSLPLSCSPQCPRLAAAALPHQTCECLIIFIFSSAPDCGPAGVRCTSNVQVKRSTAVYFCPSPPPQIVDLLGQAAFSRAVQALDLRTGALVCLKIIKVR